jgi:hypothetical protein
MEWNLSQYCSLCGFLPPSLSPDSWGYTGLKGRAAVPRPSQISEYDKLMNQTMAYEKHRSPQANDFMGPKPSENDSEEEDAEGSPTLSEDLIIETKLQDLLLQLVHTEGSAENFKELGKDDVREKTSDRKRKKRSPLPTQEELFTTADQVMDSSGIVEFPNDPETPTPSSKSLAQLRMEWERAEVGSDLMKALDPPDSMRHPDWKHKSADIPIHYSLGELTSPSPKRRRKEPRDSKMN